LIGVSVDIEQFPDLKLPGFEAISLADGRVAEWFKATVLKTVVRETVPWVRIPPLPPFICLNI
jgi:hypothetical protein